MPSAYTDVNFSNAPLGITANKLNLLRDDLSVAIAASAGDMTKAIYDTDNNGKVDTCDSLAWTAVTGKPSTFPPNLHQASHVTGTDQIPLSSTSTKGLMPQANTNPNSFYASDATQKQVTYAMLGGIQPAPATHASTHLPGAADPISYPAWTPYTATVTPQTGSITTQTNTSAFLQIGKLVFFRVNVIVSNVGTASGSMSVNLPVVLKATCTFMFREIAITGVLFALTVGSGATSGSIAKYDNSNPTWTSGFQINMTGSYEAN